MDGTPRTKRFQMGMWPSKRYFQVKAFSPRPRRSLSSSASRQNMKKAMNAGATHQ